MCELGFDHRDLTGHLVTAELAPTNEQLALIWWSIACEPGDEFAGYLREALGPSKALELVRAGSVRQLIRELVETNRADAGASRFGDLERVAAEALARWNPRLQPGALGTAFGWLKRSRSWIVTSSSTLWPEGLTHLSWGSPALLWGRGCAASLTSNLRYLAIVGSRGATNYGNWVTSDLVEELKSRKLAIVSGGAYGIDAVAHRSALAVQLPTIAVMAGGVDRFYPSGNQDLLEQVLRQGAVVSELPPGSSPTKWRFLQRNRLIAALSDAVVVVEAGKRSGSISTVNHATVLGRPVGAIPGPVTATSSVGCNRLIQSAQAELIQDADDVLSLLGLSNTLDVFSEAQPAGLGPLEIRLLDALGNKPKDPQQLSKMAGLSPTEAHVAFTQLVLKGKAGQTDAGWLKVAK